MKTSRWVIALLLFEAALAGTLLWYDSELCARVLFGGARNLATDTIVICYVFSGLLLALAGGFLGFGTRTPLRLALHGVAVLAAGIWLLLHLGGFMYSHDSMFIGR